MATMLVNKDQNMPIKARELALLNALSTNAEKLASIPATQAELSQLLGVHRTSISKELQELTRRGFIFKQNVIVGDGKLEPRFALNSEGTISLTTPHKELGTLVIARLFTGGSFKKNSSALTPVNKLLLLLLITHADNEGRIETLSQNTMCKLIGLSEAQLKSQIKKLRNARLIHRVVPGGAFKGITGRVTSKLQVNLEAVTEALHLNSVEAHGKKLRSSTNVELSSISNIHFYFEASIDKSSNRLKTDLICEPLKVYPDVVKYFIPSSRASRRRFYRYIARLCISYANQGINTLTSTMNVLRPYLHQFLDGEFDELESAKRFDALIVSRYKHDLYKEGQAPHKTHATSTYQSIDTRSSDLKLQANEVVEVLRKITWIIMLDYSLEPHINQAVKNGWQLELSPLNPPGCDLNVSLFEK